MRLGGEGCGGTSLHPLGCAPPHSSPSPQYSQTRGLHRGCLRGQDRCTPGTGQVVAGVQVGGAPSPPGTHPTAEPWAAFLLEASRICFARSQGRGIGFKTSAGCRLHLGQVGSGWQGGPGVPSLSAPPLGLRAGRVPRRAWGPVFYFSPSQPEMSPWDWNSPASLCVCSAHARLSWPPLLPPPPPPPSCRSL